MPPPPPSPPCKDDRDASPSAPWPRLSPSHRPRQRLGLHPVGPYSLEILIKFKTRPRFWRCVCVGGEGEFQRRGGGGGLTMKSYAENPLFWRCEALKLVHYSGHQMQFINGRHTFRRTVEGHEYFTNFTTPKYSVPVNLCKPLISLNVHFPMSLSPPQLISALSGEKCHSCWGS